MRKMPYWVGLSKRVYERALLASEPTPEPVRPANTSDKSAAAEEAMNEASGMKAQMLEAVDADDADAVTALLESIEDPNGTILRGKVRPIADSDFETPWLLYAIMHDRPAVVGVLWKWNAPYRERMIYSVAQGGTARVMKALLNAGADPNHRIFCEGVQSLNNDFTAQQLAEMWSVKTPLSEAVDRAAICDFIARAFPATKPEDQAGVVALLLERGAEPDVLLDINGNRPLFDAMNWRNSDVMELLLRAGASANALPGTTWTPLMAAALQGYAEGARLLLRYGADPSKRNSDGRTALDIARRWNNNETAEVLAEHSE